MDSIEILLEPFVGYFDLGMLREAGEELENLPAEVKDDPMVLLARMEWLMEMEHWEEGASFGKSSCNLWPRLDEFFFKTAYCLHEMKRTQEAKETLVGAPLSIRKGALYFYNLACYETQLGNMEEAKSLLKTCFRKDSDYRDESMADPDLTPLKAFLKDL